MILALAGFDSFGYQLVLFLHILTAIVGFGSTFVWPVLGAKSRSLPPEHALALNRTVLQAGKFLTTPFTIATGVFGMLLIVLSEDFYSFAQPWVSASLTVWLAGFAVAYGLHLPNLKAMLALQEEMVAGGPPQGGPPPQAAEMAERGKKAGMFGGILHLLFATALVLMVFFPEPAPIT